MVIGHWSLVIAPKGPRYGRRVGQRRRQRAWQGLGLVAMACLLVAGVYYLRRPAPVALQPVWTIPVSETILAPPRVDGDWAYVASADGLVICLEVSSGGEVWRQNLPATTVRTRPLVGDGQVFIGSEDGSLYSLLARDGSIQWQRRLGGAIVCDPLRVRETLFVGADDGFLYSLDVRTGQERWPPIPVGAPISSGPAWVDPYIVCGTTEGILLLFEPTRYQMQRLRVGSSIHSRPVPIYAVSGQQPAISSEDSELRTKNSELAAYPALLAVGADDGSLHVIDLARGDQIGAIRARDAVRSVPLVYGGTVFFGSNDRHLYAADLASDTVYWKVRTGGSVRAEPCLLSSVPNGPPLGGSPPVRPLGRGPASLVFGSDDGTVRMLDPQTGREMAKLRAGGPIAGLDVSGPWIVYASWDGTVRCARAFARP